MTLNYTVLLFLVLCAENVMENGEALVVTQTFKEAAAALHGFIKSIVNNTKAPIDHHYREMMQDTTLKSLLVSLYILFNKSFMQQQYI